MPSDLKAHEANYSDSGEVEKTLFQRTSILLSSTIMTGRGVMLSELVIERDVEEPHTRRNIEDASTSEENKVVDPSLPPYRSGVEAELQV